MLPTFDEGDEARLAVSRVIDLLDSNNLANFRLRVIVDGPNPATETATRLISDPRVSIRVLPMNMGKGYAVRMGLRDLKANYVGFIDGDLDIAPEAIIRVIEILDADLDGRIGGIYGSKIHRQSEVEYPVLRRILSFLYRKFIRALVGLDIEDTQTGIKIFRAEAIDGLLDELSENGYLLDVEILARMYKRGWKLEPVPVRIQYNYSSTIKGSTILVMALQSFRLALRVRRNFK